jgi:hypothetical protein
VDNGLAHYKAATIPRFSPLLPMIKSTGHCQVFYQNKDLQPVETLAGDSGTRPGGFFTIQPKDGHRWPLQQE